MLRSWVKIEPDDYDFVFAMLAGQALNYKTWCQRYGLDIRKWPIGYYCQGDKHSWYQWTGARL